MLLAHWCGRTEAAIYLSPVTNTGAVLQAHRVVSIDRVLGTDPSEAPVDKSAPGPEGCLLDTTLKTAAEYQATLMDNVTGKGMSDISKLLHTFIDSYIVVP